MPELPKSIGGYEVLEELGKGATGTVYRCLQASLHREVAVKVLAPVLTHDEKFIARFSREAKVTAGLRHPHIVEVFNAAEEDGVFFIAMELIEGEDLYELFQKHGTIELQKALTWTDQLLSALEVAHDKGVTHRDIKPANILIREDGTLALADFSVAHLADERLTKTGSVLGTVEYMAPEMLEGKPVSGQVDIYAVGLILYEMLTGTHPFRRDSAGESMKAHLLEDAPDPSKLTNSIDPQLGRLVLKAIDRDPEQRFRTATEMRAALKEFVSPISQLARKLGDGEMSLDEGSRLYGKLKDLTDDADSGSNEAPEATEAVEPVEPAKRTPFLLKMVGLIVGLLMLMVVIAAISGPKVDIKEARRRLPSVHQNLDAAINEKAFDKIEALLHPKLVVELESGEKISRDTFVTALRSIEVEDCESTLESVRIRKGGVASHCRTSVKIRGVERVLNIRYLWRKSKKGWSLHRISAKP